VDVQHLRGRGWLKDEFEKTVGSQVSDFHKGNTKARTRMIAQYALVGELNYLVIGTDHGAGSVTGFFTKYGDGGADILPLLGLNKRQNRAPLSAFNLARGLVKRGPPAVLNLSSPTHRASAYWKSEVTWSGKDNRRVWPAVDGISCIGEHR
jgi:NAD+ synthetase